MVNKLLALILLVSHINSTMLLPQVAEHDVYFNGQQADDINSVLEYIQQEVLNIQDKSPEDEDNDAGKEINPVASMDQSCDLKFRIHFEHPDFTILQCYHKMADQKTPGLSMDISTPPPKA
ncbi:MAG: hypothetical protein ACXWB9_02375 [Flavisolibacter sp.]